MKLFFNLFGPIVLLILVVLSLVDGSALNFTTKWIPFLGRFHPVLLHLPIGLFAGVVLLEIYLFIRPVSRVPEKIHFLLTASFYTTAVSALLGIFLSWEGGYEGDAVNFHKWAGIVMAGLILGLDWLAKLRRADSEQISAPYLAGLVVTIIAITITGHQGGSLTHGSNFLTEHNPFGDEVEVTEITESTPVFESHIQPVLKDYCYQCHSEEKIKGELRLDSFEFIMAGGVNGPVLVPGDSEGSTMLHVLHLPIDEDEHMPPKGKPQPSEEILNLLAWWIDEGASDTATRDELNVTQEVAPLFLEIDVLEFESRETMATTMEALGESETFSVYFLAQEDHRLGVRGNKATDADVEKLMVLKPNIVEVNLAKSAVTDAALEKVGQMTNLTHLHLNNTGVTDAGIEHLSNLYQLEYLNLYGTAITDQALLVLRRLKNLKKVFLWETSVTQEAVEDLHKSVFNAVGSEQLRLDIQELTKKRDSLEVEIVSAFDFEAPPAVPVVAEKPEDSEISISDVMINFHKGKDSIAAQARDGKADPADIMRMLESYQALLDLTPPKGTIESWKSKTQALIDSAGNLSSENPATLEAYKVAVNCKACHSEHRTD